MKGISLLLFVILLSMATSAKQRLYRAVSFCENTLKLYDNGRADWYDCEMLETFYGHYWVENDTLCLETFCSDYCHEDHSCLTPHLAYFILSADTLRHIGNITYIGRDHCYSDNLIMLEKEVHYIRVEIDNAPNMDSY